MKNKFMKIALCCLLCGFCFLSIGCKASTQDLYNYGLNMATVMEQMVKNEDYVNMIGKDNDLTKYIANDYDAPIDVYKILYPSNNELIKYDENYNEINNLPSDIKDYIIQRYNFTVTITEILFDNCNFNDIDISTSFYYEEKIDETIKDRVALLYIFETGVPIIVIFEPQNGYIDATSLFMPIDSIKTLSGARAIFEPFGCTVDKYI